MVAIRIKPIAGLLVASCFSAAPAIADSYAREMAVVQTCEATQVCLADGKCKRARKEIEFLLVQSPQHSDFMVYVKENGSSYDRVQVVASFTEEDESSHNLNHKLIMEDMIITRGQLLLAYLPDEQEYRWIDRMFPGSPKFDFIVELDNCGDL